MILTRSEILKEIKNGKLKITPFNKNNIGPASIDLEVDNKFRIFDVNKSISLSEKTDYKKYTREIKIKDYIEIKPGQFILGITKERVTLPDNICAWIGGRSRFARLGLLIHVTAAFIQPGADNKTVLEIYNLGHQSIKLKPGTKISQLILERCEGRAKYKGRFAKQNKV